ncbi:hypothetical protein [Ruegeria arenilitoris]|uniref:hypothetical protein n=1 Tax=Ruegeria arenilitoris TaxID=1173585 RepID=UPI00147CD6A4|nr:hypothetical protein [Ruegeria arenilitoris]
MIVRTATILKRIGNEHLSLHCGAGYWFFNFDDGDIFETDSVYTMRLNDLSLDQWMAEGRVFIKQIEEVRRTHGSTQTT